MIKYLGELTTRTADLTTTKVVWNSVLSTEVAKYACLDVGNFYLETPMERYEYMKMPLSLFTEWIKQQYNLEENALNVFVYWEIRKAVYGISQAGMLANLQLRNISNQQDFTR